ncbi:TRAF-like family protein [Corchorus olitorius]|uniref:TRAF-like family protein n=1 Tax=Corchorus olitorius TaxID=93759 RepID=A0A1R3GZY1_9ROSI|nr:TRAF-like family protein [Corchorus olitorius]
MMEATITSSRKEVPAHNVLKIETFWSVVSSIDKYESHVFEASGYKWKLLFYPKKTHEGIHDISLNLGISEKDNTLSLLGRSMPWKLRLCRKLRLYPKGNGEGKGKCVSIYLEVHNPQNHSPGWENNTGWGFGNFLSLADLNSPTNGYLVGYTLSVEGEIIAFSEQKGNMESDEMLKDELELTMARPFWLF